MIVTAGWLSVIYPDAGKAIAASPAQLIVDAEDVCPGNWREKEKQRCAGEAGGRLGTLYEKPPHQKKMDVHLLLAASALLLEILVVVKVAGETTYRQSNGQPTTLTTQ